MGMCCFDVTRSLTVAGRLWSKDVNRTKTITADKNADRVLTYGKRYITEVITSATQSVQAMFGTSNYALAA